MIGKHQQPSDLQFGQIGHRLQLKEGWIATTLLFDAAVNLSGPVQDTL